MNYYISDLHFGHKDVLKFDNRPYITLTGKPFMAMNVGCMKDYMDYTPRTLDEIMSAWQNERMKRSLR